MAVASITIIIPMLNEEQFVIRCLDSVLPQLGNLTSWEVLCVDGASTDRTSKIVSEFAERDPRVTLVANPNKTVPFGMNIGIRRARGDAILRMDCHATYAPDYVGQCLEVLQRTGADNVGGYISTEPDVNSATGRAIATAI